MNEKSEQTTENYFHNSHDAMTNMNSENDPTHIAAGDYNEEIGGLREDELPWYSRVLDVIEENPAATAAGVASAIGVLVGAGYLGRKAMRSEPESTLESLHATLNDVLSSGAEAFSAGKKKSKEFSGQAAAAAGEYAHEAHEQLDSVGSWLKQSASKLADELPGAIEHAGKRSLDAVSRAAKEQPAMIGTLALASAVALGTFFYAKSADKSPKRGRRRTMRASDATREELYEKARKLGIEGRSGMSKDELQNAIKGHRH